MRESTPIEIALGRYERVPNNTLQHTGNLIKTQGEISWKNDAGVSWSLTPNTDNESFIHSNDSPTPNEKFQLILVRTDCGIYNLGFKYVNYYYWKPKRSLADESPQVVKAIGNLKLPKDFGSHAIDLREVFRDSKGDSLLIFVTSKDTALIAAKIVDQNLILSGGDEGSTTMYVMALDKNGGLAVDEFDVLVNKTISTVETQNPRPNIVVSPSITHDFVYVSGASNNSSMVLSSLIGTYHETISISDNLTKIDLSHLSSGVYLLIVTDNNTGRLQWSKVIKY